MCNVFHTTIAPTSGIYGSTVTVSNPIREGYTFTGWTASGTGASLSGTNLTIGASNITLTANWRAQSLILAYSCANESIGTSPNFTYTGNCAVIDDGNNNWRVKFLTSGTLIFYDLANISNGIDVFLVGGGGGSSSTSYGGGGGGYTYTALTQSVIANVEYEIVIGAGVAVDTNGGQSSAFGYTANGGNAGIDRTGGAGGSGIVIIRSAK